jgi:pilus assembly protein CpaD
MITRGLLRTGSLLAVLVAGSCSTPELHPVLFEDGAANHPIVVTPSYATLKFYYSGGIAPDDEERLEAFVQEYLAHGNGAISISVPPGPDSQGTIAVLGERMAQMGVPRARILVGVDDHSTDRRIEVGYVTYAAHTDPCGSWTVNAGETFENQTMPNFGCSVQNNIAAEIADPRDLTELHALSAPDVQQRYGVIGKYEQGQTTQAAKTQAQSAVVSDVGSANQ